jgi:hypothetical protein
MRTILRAGVIVGGTGFVILYALQPSAGFAVVGGVALTGALAGLMTAKWLERTWYGRQLLAGLRAGALAAGLAAAGALLSLLLLGPRSVGTLAAHAPWGAARLVWLAAPLGWAGVDVAGVLLALGIGALAGALLAQIAGWSKSARAVRTVEQARLAAQALNRDDGWRAQTGAPAFGQPIHASTLLTQLGIPALGAAPVSTGLSATGQQPAPARTAAYFPALAPQAQPATPASRAAHDAEMATEPALPAALPPHPASPGKAPGSRTPSAKRRADMQLTEAMREALAAWADDLENGQQPPAASARDERGGKAKAARTPQPSAYLNSAPPPKRNRKKQATRDWLC